MANRSPGSRESGEEDDRNTEDGWCSPIDNDNEKSASTSNAKKQSRQSNTPTATLLSLLHCLSRIIIPLLSTSLQLALENYHLSKTLKQEFSQTYQIFSCFMLIFVSSLVFFHSSLLRSCFSKNHIAITKIPASQTLFRISEFPK